MKNFDYDYKNKDKITIFAQFDKAEEIIEYYKKFKWDLIKNEKAKHATELLELTFIRPHKIDNKDKLQLYQVQMEECVNEIGKLENFKGSKTTSVGLIFGLIGLAPLVIAILMFCDVISSPLYLKIILTTIGIILTIINFITIRKINQVEEKYFINKTNKLNNTLNNIFNIVEKL